MVECESRVERVELGSADTEETRLALVEIAQELTGEVPKATSNLPGMNRAESKLYRMQLKALESAKWAKMLRTVDFGKEMAPYQPVVIKLNGRLKQYNAWAMKDKIEFSKDFARGSSPKRLMITLKHEMAHTLLIQNGINGGHDALYKTCCHVLGLHSPTSKETGYNYKHTCSECGWWLKSMVRSNKIAHTCKGKFVFLVSKAEYGRIEKIAKVGSVTIPVTLGAYQVMTVKKVEPNLKLKGERNGGTS